MKQFKMETYLLSKEFAMPDILDCDTPVRPIKHGDDLPAPVEQVPAGRPAPASFIAEWRKIIGGLLGR